MLLIWAKIHNVNRPSAVNISFSPSKSIPVTSAARLQRYALFLSGFNYDIEYKSTKRHCNADAMSRLPLSSSNDDDDNEQNAEDIFHISQIEYLPLTHVDCSAKRTVIKPYHKSMNKCKIDGNFIQKKV